VEMEYFKGRTPPLLEIRNLTREFRTGLYFGTSFKAVDDVNFILGQEKPKILSIAGESGCGKTTLAKMILGIQKPTRGMILYKGKNVSKLRGKEEKRFRCELQPIFQDPFETFNPFNRIDYYLISCALNFNVAKSKEEAFEAVRDVLQNLGMNPEYVRGKFSHELSGGELQRLAIGRALISKPSLLVADEPVSMVDASVRIEILNLLADLEEKFDLSIIYITHDLSTAYYLCARTNGEIAIMHRGGIVEYGSIEEVLTNPLHPYTKLLIESIPEPNPQKKWAARIELSPVEIEEFKMEGCKLARRCIHSTDICLKKTPPMKYVNERLVRCWLC